MPKSRGRFDSHFTIYKYHSLENDFLLIESSEPTLHKAAIGKLAASWCHRRKGIGADGLLWLRPARDQHSAARVDVFNQDGSWAERSGNGLRITGVHLCSARRFRSNEITLETGSGKARVAVKMTTNVTTATAFLPPADFRTLSLPMNAGSETMIGKMMTFGSQRIKATCLSVGNPHLIAHISTLPSNWQELGKRIENDRRFPNRTNVEFVRVVNRNQLEVTIWERGAGATGSSGTGGAASVAATIALGLTNRKVAVQFPAGKMMVHWPSQSEDIATTAPVHFVGKIAMER